MFISIPVGAHDPAILETTSTVGYVNSNLKYALGWYLEKTKPIKYLKTFSTLITHLSPFQSLFEFFFPNKKNTLHLDTHIRKKFNTNLERYGSEAPWIF